MIDIDAPPTAVTQAKVKKRKRTSKSSGGCKESFLGFDKFAGPVGFKIDDGSETYPSKCGAVFSLCSLLLTLAYTA